MLKQNNNLSRLIAQWVICAILVYVCYFVICLSDIEIFSKYFDTLHKRVVLIVFTALVFRCFIWYIFSLSQLKISEECFKANVENEIIHNVIKQLRRRSVYLKITGYFSLFLILVALIGGMFVFSKAEKYATNVDSLGAKKIERLERNRDSLRDALARIQTADANSDNTSIDTGTIEKSLEDLEVEYRKAKDSFENSKVDAPVKNNSEGIIKQNDHAYTAYIVTVLSTKIGSVTMLLFLVQILVTLYRNNIKLASFYDAKADTLQMVSIEGNESIDKLNKFLSPDNAIFDKPPKHPTKHAIDLAKELANLMSKGSKFKVIG